MHIKKIKAKYFSLAKIIKIVESHKNITLINILKLTKLISFYYERALQAKMLIEAVMQNHVVDSPLLAQSETPLEITRRLFSKKQNTASSNIWIYVTEQEQFATNSYLKQEQALKQTYTKGDLVIAIGQRANEFCAKHNFDMLYQADNNEVSELTKVLPTILATHIKINGFYNVRFLINSSKIKESYLDVLPLNKLNFNLNVKKIKTEAEINIKKLKIYPDVDNFVDSELHSYLTYMSLTLLSESALIYQKYKLVSENQKLNDLDKKQKHLRLEMLRAKRELEVEQLALLSKKKDLLHEVKKESYE